MIYVTYLNLTATKPNQRKGVVIAMKDFSYFKVSFDVDNTNELLNQIERADKLIKELKDVLYRISGMRGTITAKEAPPTDVDGK